MALDSREAQLEAALWKARVHLAALGWSATTGGPSMSEQTRTEKKADLRPVFKRWPWLMPVALVLAFPLFILMGALEGLKWWLEEAKWVIR